MATRYRPRRLAAADRRSRDWWVNSESMVMEPAKALVWKQTPRSIPQPTLPHDLLRALKLVQHNFFNVLDVPPHSRFCRLGIVTFDGS